MPFLCRFREKRIKKQGFTHIFNNTLLYPICMVLSTRLYIIVNNCINNLLARE
nr:MAG TPA: hypothetical protein [Caudoviricetes sp.]